MRKPWGARNFPEPAPFTHPSAGDSQFLSLKRPVHPLNTAQPYPVSSESPAKLALRPDRPESRKDQLATREAAQQDGFLREVDDALREDEFKTALQRYGIPLGIGLLLGLLALAGYLWWSDHQKGEAARRGEEFTLALDQVESGNLTGARTKLDALAKEGGGASQAAAMMLQAGILLETGKTSEAAIQFAAIAADDSAPQAYRDLATIREITVKFDTMKPDDVVSRLKTMAVPGNAWFASAGELVGMAYVKQGRNDLAGPLFAAIAKDKDSPESARSRARQMAGLLGVDAIDDVEKAAGLVPGADGGPAPAAEQTGAARP